MWSSTSDSRLAGGYGSTCRRIAKASAAQGTDASGRCQQSQRRRLQSSPMRVCCRGAASDLQLKALKQDTSEPSRRMDQKACHPQPGGTRNEKDTRASSPGALGPGASGITEAGARRPPLRAACARGLPRLKRDFASREMPIRAPKHLSSASGKLFRRLAEEYRLAPEPHALEVLRLACEALDRCAQAREVIERDGPFVTNRFGERRPHPAIAVERELADRGPARAARAKSRRRGIGRPSSSAYSLMPVRPRRVRRPRHELTLDRDMVLSIGPQPRLPSEPPSLRPGSHEWEVLRYLL
jgi:hypothetical protein